MNDSGRSGGVKPYGSSRLNGEAPLCATKGCSRHVGKNMRTGQWYKYCAECGRRQKLK